MATVQPVQSLPTFDLHTYFRSSCSARLRIALNLKDIPYNPIFVHLLKDEQFSESHRALNPSLSVPVLVVHNNNNDDDDDDDADNAQPLLPCMYLFCKKDQGLRSQCRSRWPVRWARVRLRRIGVRRPIRRS